jgi:hypothetical protein
MRRRLTVAAQTVSHSPQIDIKIIANFAVDTGQSTKIAGKSPKNQ